MNTVGVVLLVALLVVCFIGIVLYERWESKSSDDSKNDKIVPDSSAHAKNASKKHK